MEEEEIKKARMAYEKSKISSSIEKETLNLVIKGGLTGFITVLSMYAPKIGHPLLEILPDKIKKASNVQNL